MNAGSGDGRAAAAASHRRVPASSPVWWAATAPDELEPGVAGVGGDQGVGPADQVGRGAAQPPHQLQRRLLGEHVGRVDAVEPVGGVERLGQPALVVQLLPLGREGGRVGRVAGQQRVGQGDGLVPEAELLVHVQQQVRGPDVAGAEFEVADEQPLGGHQVRLFGPGHLGAGDGQREDGIGVGAVVAQVLLELDQRAAVVAAVEGGQPVGLDQLLGGLVAVQLDADAGPGQGGEGGPAAGQQRQSAFGFGAE